MNEIYVLIHRYDNEANAGTEVLAASFDPEPLREMMRKEAQKIRAEVEKKYGADIWQDDYWQDYDFCIAFGWQPDPFQAENIWRWSIEKTEIVPTLKHPHLGLLACVRCMEQHGYQLIQWDTPMHVRLRKEIDGNELHVLLVAPHEGNKNRYMLRADFLENHDRWSNADYEAFFTDEESFAENWNHFWWKYPGDEEDSNG